MNKTNKIYTYISAGVLLLSMFLCWRLFEQIVLISIDDAMYAGFTQHGLKHFIDKNIWHYISFNGRFFVHFIMQLVVVFEEHLYAILFPLFIATSTFLFSGIAKPDWSIPKRLLASSLVLILFLGLDFVTITYVMWIAGGFNYVFPLFIISIFYFLFLKYRNKEKSLLWLLPFSFICGAATEQYGMYTIGLIVMTYFVDFLENKKIDKKVFAYLVTSIAGLLTVLLSPSTLDRIDESAEKTASTSSSFIDGILLNWSYLGGANSFKAIPILFMLIVGILVLSRFLTKNKSGLYHPLLILGIPFSAISYIANIYNMFALSAIVTFLFVGIMIVTMFMNKQTIEIGKLLVCGFGTFFMMSITPMAGNRTCIPCILTFIIVLVIMILDSFSNPKRKIVIPSIVVGIAVCVCLVNYVVSYENYHKDGVWQQGVYEQLSSASETGIIEVDWDSTYYTSTLRYRNATLIDGYPLSYYQDKFNIPDNVKYIFKSEKYEVFNLSCNGLYSQIPAIKMNDRIYITPQFPYLDLCIDELIQMNVYQNSADEIVQLDIKDLSLKCSGDECISAFTTILVDIDVACEQWEYSYTFDSDKNTYILNHK